MLAMNMDKQPYAIWPVADIIVNAGNRALGWNEDLAVLFLEMNGKFELLFQQQWSYRDKGSSYNLFYEDNGIVCLCLSTGECIWFC